MSTKEDAKKAYVTMREENSFESGGFEIVEEGDHSKTLQGPDGKRFKVSGEKRVNVVEVVEAKISKCEECGEEFTPSKFTPYQKFCPKHSKKSNGIVQAPKEEVECPKCGKTWERSKFLPYITECPECRKATRNANAKVKRAVKSATDEKAKSEVEA